MNKKIKFSPPFDLVRYINSFMNKGIEITTYCISYDDGYGVGFNFYGLNKDNLFLFDNKKLTKISEIDNENIKLHWYINDFECYEEEVVVPSDDTICFLNLYLELVKQNKLETFNLEETIISLLPFEDKPFANKLSWLLIAFEKLKISEKKENLDPIRRVKSDENLSATTAKVEKEEPDPEELTKRIRLMHVGNKNTANPPPRRKSF